MIGVIAEYNWKDALPKPLKRMGRSNFPVNIYFFDQNLVPHLATALTFILQLDLVEVYDGQKYGMQGGFQSTGQFFMSPISKCTQ